MDKKILIKQPKYQLIAEDIAAKILEKKYIVGEKIYARSSIATTYGVSSETARRAIAVLQDLGIVEATKGSGVMITSYERAAEYIHRMKDVTSVRELQSILETSIDRQRAELDAIEGTLTEFISRTNRLHSINPFVPFQVVITDSCPHLEKTVGEMNFWQQTGATIIGIKRDDELILSPGPYAQLEIGNTVYFIGNDQSFQVVKNFLSN